ncbi:guanine nucleotide exchange factor [Lasiosphaeria miniovina]|uniref:Guanine nucleotide exchange factor n=1 Tax=Lasiosphaeria miniovina TaxID=1954250 RepID=A0AA40EAD9_9PEZI|nr:guanine nucleotide exchange factor [Lasiosphaeria miniovina]KAK0734299.1 guanine nucleotide exchange factor [Lasiosphaeria miniovina]
MAQRRRPPGNLTGPGKLDAVTDLMDKLTEDLKSTQLSPPERDSALEELKLYGRDPRDARPIFTNEGIETLTRHAFDSTSDTTCRNALKVLCNALFLRSETRQMFVDLGYEAKACSKLQSGSWNDEFLVSRLILLTTYETNINLVKLIDQHQLADTMVQNLERHAKRLDEKAARKTAYFDPMEGMALEETLKLLFNVTNFCSERVSKFAPAVSHIVTLLCKDDIPATRTPLVPPFSLFINALVNLDLSSGPAQAALFPASEPEVSANRLIDLLDLALKAYPESELEQTTSPLVCVILSVYEHAPDAVRRATQGRLLPTEDDRKNVLGKGDTLPARLLRNSTNALAPQLRTAISQLLFDMSDKDATKFVKNVGYGFASGFLFQNQIPIPEAASEGYDVSSGSSEGASSNIRKAVNPITGQFLDAEQSISELPEMTDEEKEREAEKLFVLFERLKKTGVMSVQNPIEKAVQEGRFEELPDDYEEDGDGDATTKKV